MQRLHETQGTKKKKKKITILFNKCFRKKEKLTVVKLKVFRQNGPQQHLKSRIIKDDVIE